MQLSIPDQLIDILLGQTGRGRNPDRLLFTGGLIFRGDFFESR